VNLILSRGAHRCLKFIKSYDFQRRGWSCPSQTTLAKDLGVDLRTVKRYVAELTRKSYLLARRRPNSSSVYSFGVRKGQNVPAKVTQNVPADVPADVPTIQLFLMQPNGPAQTAQKPTQEFAFMDMPAYYTTEDDRKLWRMAARWIVQNNPDLGAYSFDRAAPIMELLEAAGAANLPENGPLPAIVWPPADLPARARHPDAKPPAAAQSSIPQQKTGVKC
jgi:DNA-binding transcriptional MocR family regulator